MSYQGRSRGQPWGPGQFFPGHPRGRGRGGGRGRGRGGDYIPDFPISARTMQDALDKDHDLSHLVASPAFKKLLLSETMTGENKIKGQMENLFKIMLKLFEQRPNVSADKALLAISSSEIFGKAIPLHSFTSDGKNTFKDCRNDILSVCQKLIENFHISWKSKIESVEAIITGLQMRFKDDTVFVTEAQRLQELPMQLEAEYNEMKSDMAHIQNRPIYPSVEEITGNSKDTHIEPFIVNGPFESFETYAKKLFELTREDFMRPLRDGINKLLENEAVKLGPLYANARRREQRKLLKEVTEVRVYEAEPRGVILSRQGQNYKLHFYPKRTINWENSKILMHGSLLVLSCDMFETDSNLVVGIISDIRQLRMGMIEIKLMSGSLWPDTTYIMVESSAFFLPVKNVLERIQSDDFIRIPFKNHFVTGVDNQLLSQPTPPKYLDDKTKYNLRALFPYGYHGHVYDFVKKRTWDSEAQMIVQGEQLRAVKSALTDCISVIQGPPGTGKTFTAKLIMRILLDNSHLCDGPILLICYTNHALDQFLEGILDFEESVVRFGGMSKSEKVAPYSIHEVRRRFRTSDGVHTMYKEAERALHKIQGKKNELEQMFDRAYTDVVSLSDLLEADVIDDEIQNAIYQSVLKRFGEDLSKDTALFLKEESAASNILKEWLEIGYIGYRKRYAREIGNMATYTEKEQFNNINHDDLERMSHEYIMDEERRKTDERNYERKIADEIFNDITDSNTDLTNLENSEDLCRKWVRYLRRYEKEVIELALGHNHDNKMESTDQLWLNAKSGNHEARLIFYGRLLKLYQDHIVMKIQKLNDDHSEADEAFQSVRLIRDTELCRNFKIVAMTTTLATQNFRLLRDAHCKIVMAEESAEIPESHLVACLTEYTQQVILIGDHQQLRPKVNCYELERDYNFGISLFERLIKNDFNFVRLGVQYRMQPNISTYMQQCFYDGLDNSRTVFQRPSDIVPALMKDVQFINYGTHRNPEQFYEAYDENGTSKCNTAEAEFAVLIAEFLVGAGYNPQNITILTFYISQFFKIREKLRQLSPEKRVEVQTVDNFQGKENNIIILSTVRSNAQNNGGFATVHNRVCVALSRARSALIVIGNITMLASIDKKDKTNVWKDIYDHARARGNIDSGVFLRCPQHKGYRVKIEYNNPPRPSIERKKSFPLFGCTAQCNANLKCGHICPKTCHPPNQHERYLCLVSVTKQLTCAHSYAPMYCHLDPKNYKCKKQCCRKVSCGHACDQPCFVKCDLKNCKVLTAVICKACKTERKTLCKHLGIPCSERCTEKLSCGHECPLKCYQHTDDIHVTFNCKKECSRKCKSCGGKSCKALCFQACGVCTLEVPKTLPCGHSQKGRCNVPSEEIDCQTKCERTLDCGHECKLKCFQDCSEANCDIIRKLALPCGHEKKVHCVADPHNETLIKKCDEKCLTPLDPCGHPCYQACFEECDSAKCRVPVIKTLSCNHKVKVPCNVSEIKCMVKVTYVDYCGHQRSITCYKRDDPYDCKIPVKKSLQCGHYQHVLCYASKLPIICNTKISGELPCGHVWKEVKCSDDVEKLSKMCKCPCNKKLQCGHPCKLKCNERCSWSACTVVIPTKCQTCDTQIHVECGSEKINKLCNSCTKL